MKLKTKKTLSKCVAWIFAVLFCVAALIVAYAVSPLHPKNISDEVIINNGAEYTFKLTGVSKYDEGGFFVTSNDLWLSDKKLYVSNKEDGFACVTEKSVSDDFLLGKYNSLYVPYEKYTFCGERFKSPQELAGFFEEPEPIYDFKLENFSYYVSDIINYKRKFTGMATAKIYRGRYIFTEIYIGDEKVLELK